jgi:shikimate kinase/3-dehydroquinate synthase
VLADTDALATLPAREFRAGYVEAAKFGLLGDAAYFAWLEQNARAVFAKDPAALQRAIATAVQGKADIVARDETETGERMLLNLGHTFGHALEAWAGFSDRLLHGEAIAIGICLAFRLSEQLGFVGNNSLGRVETHFASLGLPTRIDEIPGSTGPDAQTLVKIMAQDKKVRSGRLTLILARGIGEAFITRDIGSEAVQEFLARQIATARSRP